MGSRAGSRRWLPWLLLGMLALATTEFVLRGPVRALNTRLNWSYIDFTGPYSSTRAWLRGLNPFDHETKLAILQESGRKRIGITETVYPPSAFPLFAPFAALPWHAAKLAWLSFSLILLLVSLGALVTWANLRSPATRLLGFLAFAIGFAPCHRGLYVGQPAIPTVALIILALCFIDRSRAVWAGVLLGMAAAMKPQLGVPVLLYFVLTRRWLGSVVTLSVLLGLTVAGAARLEMIVDNWSHLWVTQMQSMGGLNMSVDNLQRYKHLQLNVLLHCFWENRIFVNVVATSILGVLGSWWAWRVVRHGKKVDDLLAVGPLFCLNLLAVYHWSYDATILLIPLAWAVSNVDRRHGWIPVGVLILLATFLVPGSAALVSFMERGYVPNTVATAWWWHVFVMAHQTWALCALLGCQLWILSHYSYHIPGTVSGICRLTTISKDKLSSKHLEVL